MTVEQLIDELRQRRDALGDGRDCRSINEQETYHQSYTAIVRTMTALMNPGTEKHERVLAEWAAERAAVRLTEADVQQQLAAAPGLDTVEKRFRDREAERQRGLLGSLRLIQSQLAEIDQRIADRTTRLEQARQEHQQWVARAEALLTLVVETPAV